MATQNSKKSKKATTGKAKPSKAAAARKPVKKAPAKAKPVAKSKPAVKPAKGKKAIVAKSKPVLKVNKPVKGAKPKTKSVLATKAKPTAKKPLKAKAIVQVKAGKAPKSGAKTKSSKPVVKVAAPSKSMPVKGSHAPQKPVTLAGSGKPKTAMKVVAKPLPVSKPIPVVTKQPAAVTMNSSIGSKATDATKKPTVSTNVHSTKPVFVPKSKPIVNTPPKHITESKVKPFEKMTEKKEFKPSTMVATAEEPQKSRYSDKELEEFDQLIDQKLIIAREQLEFYLKQLEDMAENPDNKIKGLDDGLSTLESERVSSLASRQQKLIQHLENAKIRIKNKVYGICRETGKLISKERLRAVPHATLSIEAKQAQN